MLRVLDARARFLAQRMKPMGYRGDDLDLRTPERWGGKDLTRDLARVAGEPFYVDDTVLACCNHAFDLALAHRAAEVRIEHLLNAITRTDVAASVLERRGINVALLRRESATSIAADRCAAVSCRAGVSASGGDWHRGYSGRHV
jgi:Clp amino terminal domain, pathogenicity island component